MSQAALITTPRLTLRPLTLDDAPWVLRLLNEPAFLANIGDKGARDVEGAQRYLQNGPLASYANHGHGLWRVALRETDEPIGMCGPLRRDGLDHPDLGYAVFAAYAGHGYASEAAAAALGYAAETLRMTRVLAITAAGNTASQRVLEKVGFVYEGLSAVPGIEGQQQMYGWSATR